DHPPGRVDGAAPARPVQVTAPSGFGSKQRQIVALEAAQGGIVDDDAPDSPVLRQYPRLGPDFLRREHTGDRCEQRIADEQFQISAQLLDPVYLTAALDLDGDRGTAGITAQQVHRADRGRKLTAYQRETLA